ncbi:FGFR1 oncogene partner-like [Limulus polyphemus]|uniref:FGFR1 oncogene partner-like n=1 Tax=Limulus polyphemus TaxID=6850 RepID=A0ABM1C1D7_LIMPO|nr:FGFR1 oncogene partner-like [Limulus polyphemus]
MSVEDVEDSELRDLVIQTLEKNGILGKIKAQLRASVFLALENEENFKDKIPLRNKKLQDFLETEEGLLATALVREFLDFFDLEFTLAVFDPEVSVLKQLPLKNELYHKLRVTQKDEPLLATILKSSGNNQPDEKEDSKSHCQNSDSQPHSQQSEKVSVEERENEDHHQPLFLGSEKSLSGLDDPFF